jgi:large subunit ribosomal protein L5
MAARLKERYEEEIKPALIERFEYTSSMQAPRVEKITLNMGVGEAKVDTKQLDAAAEQLSVISGQKPTIRRARKSIANFKLRQGMPVGVKVTLRGERMWEMLDRLQSIAIPRIRDFRGLNPRSFDGRGNYSLGVREQIIFPEIDYDSIDQVRGLDVTITTSAQTDEEAFELLRMIGMPFRRDDGGGPSAAELRKAQQEAEEKRAAEQQAAEQLRAEQPEAPTEAAAEAEASANGGAPEGEGPSEESPQSNGTGAENE